MGVSVRNFDSRGGFFDGIAVKAEEGQAVSADDAQVQEQILEDHQE